MARLEVVKFRPMRANVEAGRLTWTSVENARALAGLPQIFWDNARPWREVNLWLMERATSGSVDAKTVLANATALCGYAAWLEEVGVGWWEFPPLKRDRCLVRYRGSLVAARDEGLLAPSTASQRMRNVIHFYRWLKATGLLSPDWPMWGERVVGLRISDAVGLERTLLVRTTDLALPNRSPRGERLEDGVLPVSVAARDQILRFTMDFASEEFFLILSIGFFSGMRLGTICDLKVQTIERAVPDPSAPGLFRLSVGPNASPPVSTKFGVTGQVFLHAALVERLRDYAYSISRLKRQAIADSAHSNLMFLTRFGNRYAQRGADKSVARNVEMNRLRRLADEQGHSCMSGFRFHQTRATFATQLARLAIAKANTTTAVGLVKEALLHKSEATALKYIRFVEKAPIKEALNNEFTKAFLGLSDS